VSTALLIALINATPSIVAAVLKILADIRAAGHPDGVPLTAEHVAKISAAVFPAPVDGTGPQTFDNPDGAE
jgi:hypothetical protein